MRYWVKCNRCQARTGCMSNVWETLFKAFVQCGFCYNWHKDYRRVKK